ncbi:hypothetical protein [Tenacibaculum maritimum]|uniref:Uncharacterized protein n=1 Tax=Tenacibaculum maritimum NCIMB 2154 TaxID=1349785 RepID=A0A2H1E9L8_9FLAO|nr:hypothetical protein [Tenacibaculum maritimum]MCD9561701.1 hypothetical protein [Tenacibaculum maritimum]MCD9564708.1 hypothetical protein [Tenacibaculum maritimum]MCD9577837.1 hypothetical protein [Tenacibaculum maritimum]MCD9585629.1 hypothetical protein [Tenacibaculum maritimum]MCD9597574.1 hypothetical protein [Tenacibaculum maritimum]
MKKVILAIAIIISSSICISCTELDDNSPEQLEIQSIDTGGENEQDPDEDPNA